MSAPSLPTCYVHDIVTAVPPHFLPTAEVAERLKATCVSPRSAKLLQRLARLTSIDQRHLAILGYQSSIGGAQALYRPADEQPHGPGMGARSGVFDEASERLVKQLMEAYPRPVLAAVDTLITVSCTHASSPGLEQPVFDHAPVSRTVNRWNLGFMGCSAALSAVRLVHQAAASEATALVVACELSSLHFQYTDQIDQMAANLLFADGAAALILSPMRSPVRVVDCHCALLPTFADQMVWRAGDNGLALQLSPELPDTLGEYLPETVETLLSSNGLTTKSIDHWLVHPGGPQILDSVEASLGLPENALRISRSVLRRYGNMSSPTILFIMRELFETGVDGLVVAMAFGPGLTIELVLFSINRDGF